MARNNKKAIRVSNKPSVEVEAKPAAAHAVIELDAAAAASEAAAVVETAVETAVEIADGEAAEARASAAESKRSKKALPPMAEWGGLKQADWKSAKKSNAVHKSSEHSWRVYAEARQKEAEEICPGGFFSSKSIEEAVDYLKRVWAAYPSMHERRLAGLVRQCALSEVAARSK